MNMAPGIIRIGAAGFSYAAWRGRWYPRELAETEWLSFYARSFHSVQINSSFYRLPTPETLLRWQQQVPEDFSFSFKAPRTLTHLRRLQDPEEHLAALFRALTPVESQLGMILYQLPPRWKVNLSRLESFLEVLPEGVRQAFEFRDPSWHCDQVRDLLVSRGAIFCQHDHPQTGMTSNWITSSSVCLRLHGPVENPRRRYPDDQLELLAVRVLNWHRQGLDVFVYFNNDLSAAAPQDALRLGELLSSRT